MRHLCASWSDGIQFVTPCNTFVPTSKPRVTVTLDVEVYEQVKAIAKSQNRSMANLIENWVLEQVAAHQQGKG